MIWGPLNKEFVKGCSGRNQLKCIKGGRIIRVCKESSPVADFEDKKGARMERSFGIEKEAKTEK